MTMHVPESDKDEDCDRDHEEADGLDLRTHVAFVHHKLS
jgi:hypothetical protein